MGERIVPACLKKEVHKSKLVCYVDAFIYTVSVPCEDFVLVTGGQFSELKRINIFTDNKH